MKDRIITLIIFIFLCCYATQLNAITNENCGFNFTIPTPNAQDLGKYGIIPMNYYTGRANVSVPIYSTEQDGVPLNISLSYDTGGLLVNKIPGWVGEGWSLNVGGCITRTVCGGVDDDIDHRFNTREYGYSNYFDHNWNWLSLLNQKKYDEIAISTLDCNPDIFTFSFMGKSGRFFLGADKKWKVQSDDNIKVEFDYTKESNYIYPFIKQYYDRSYNNPRTIKGFTLIDDNGVRYIFGGTTDAIEYSIPLMAMLNNNTGLPWQADSWYLTEIQDRFGNTLYRFHYKRGKFAAQVAYNEVYEGSMLTSYMGGLLGYAHKLLPGCDTRNFPYAITINAPVYLSEIDVVDKTKITFALSDSVKRSPKDDFLPTLDYYCQRNIPELYYREYETTYLEHLAGRNTNNCFYYLQHVDPSITCYWADNFMSNIKGNYTDIREPNGLGENPNPLVVLEYSPLETISISKNGTAKQSCKLLYDDSRRIHLAEVQLCNANSEVEGKYSFEYMDYDKLADVDYMSKKFDYWGYYNANEKSNTPNSSVSFYGMLKKITYPTGGCSEFAYEQNNYSSCQTTDRTGMTEKTGSCGGVRIKSITEYDSNNTKIKKRSFIYEIPGSSKSSGQCFAEPYTSCNYTLSYKGITRSFVMGSKMSVLPMANSFGPHIGYSWVTECFEDGTKNVYHFTNFSDYPDEQPVYMGCEQINPYMRYSEIGFTRGKLLEHIVYDQSGNKVHSIQNKYSTDYKDYYAYAVAKVVFPCVVDANSAFNIPLIYVFKQFYSKFSIVESKETQYFDNDSVCDVTTYQYEDYNYGGAIVRKNRHEKTTRMSGKKEFTYVEKTYAYPCGNPYFDNSFYFPIESEEVSSNNKVLKRNYYSYGTSYIRNKTIPVLDYQTTQIGNGQAKKVVEYLSYDSNGKLLKYRELGQPITRLFWNEAIFNRLEALITSPIDIDNIKCSSSNGPTINGSSILGNSNYQVKWYRYDDSGLLEMVTSSNGYTEKYEYDDFSRLTGVYYRKEDLKSIGTAPLYQIKKYTYNYKNK